MTKFTNDQKFEAITRYKSSLEGMEEIAKSLRTFTSVVANWIQQFDYHGLAVFEKSYASYKVQFKMDVLNYKQENNVSSYEAAVFFGISSPGMIRNWRTRLEKGGLDALFSKKKGRPSMKKTNKQPKQAPVEGSPEALQAEINRLRMENEYLKKLNALVQAKGTSPKKTK
ncbi:helix-turn-helix domain-containing protein [Jeotgalibacillus terrae]|uniref:Transposase n=1 Tax=Jeotgalibacillus terrae TaxID=587735 RepID=A0ABW5ZBQ2_9BACL|nr:helix-turn-helix domain-containing protein [Jeotgalibacillus terrae]MBM7577879.1 transposase-like protein [Jeotgalibacillus terrae]